jgi:hypothetical protein
MTKNELENFGKRHKNKSFSDIMAIAYDENKRESVDLFFLEVLKYGNNIEKADKNDFLRPAKTMLESLYNNSTLIDKQLNDYINRIDKGLEN